MATPTTEEEVLMARLAFPDAQTQLAAQGVLSVLGRFEVGMYGTNISDERGSFALVADGGELNDSVGDILEVTVGRRHVYVYCFGRANIPYDLGLARRAYAAITRLSTVSLQATVSVVQA